VRDDPAPLRPERPADQVVVQIGHPLGEPEYTPVNPQPVAGPDVVSLGLVGVALGLGLCRCEVAALLSGDVEKPATQVSPVSWHGGNPA